MKKTLVFITSLTALSLQVQAEETKSGYSKHENEEFEYSKEPTSKTSEEYKKAREDRLKAIEAKKKADLKRLKKQLKRQARNN